MKILGIDPGYDRCGVAVVERGRDGREKIITSSCITTDRRSPFEERLVAVVSGVAQLMRAHRPDFCVLERLYFTKNQKTAMRVAETRGALLTEIARFHIPIREFGPGEIKVAITGNGRASKEQVIRMVQRIINTQNVGSFDDEYDAIAVALTAFASLRDYQFPTE